MPRIGLAGTGRLLRPRIVFATALVLAAFSASHAADVQTSEKPATIVGTVVDGDTGELIVGATVTITGIEPPTVPHQRSVTTGPRGEFTFSNLAAGQFSLGARMEGFSGGFYGQSSVHSLASRGLRMAPGDRVEATLKLWPSGVISGRVFASGGYPVLSGVAVLNMLKPSSTTDSFPVL